MIGWKWKCWFYDWLIEERNEKFGENGVFGKKWFKKIGENLIGREEMKKWKKNKQKKLLKIYGSRQSFVIYHLQ